MFRTVFFLLCISLSPVFAADNSSYVLGSFEGFVLVWAEGHTRTENTALISKLCAAGAKSIEVIYDSSAESFSSEIFSCPR